MRVRVDITRRVGIADPEGMTVEHALAQLGFEGVTDVHFGRTITLDVDTDDPEIAEAQVDEMCRRLLANPVIEDYVVTVEETVTT